MEYTPSSVMKHFNHLLGEMDAVYHDISLKFGLSDSAMSILYTICADGTDGSCPLQDICRRSGLSKQTVNSAIRKLEAEGIVYLNPVTQKNKNVCLTEAGRHLAGQTAQKLLIMENDIFSSWPREDVRKYLELTEAFLMALRDKAGALP